MNNLPAIPTPAQLAAYSPLPFVIRIVGTGIGFERTRRITGYLVGTLDRFNNAKRREVMDRVCHMGRRTGCCG